MSDPDAEEPPEPPETGPGPTVHAAHLIARPPPADAGEGEEDDDRVPPTRFRSFDQADHEKSDVDNPVFPSSLDVDRRALNAQQTTSATGAAPRAPG
jgi:hypothetical protein